MFYLIVVDEYKMILPATEVSKVEETDDSLFAVHTKDGKVIENTALMITDKPERVNAFLRSEKPAIFVAWE